jgi:hypothetical protein
MIRAMSEPPVPATGPRKGGRVSKLTRRAVLAVPLPALGVTALTLWATNPFTATASSTAGTSTPTPVTASITRQDLASQLTLNATLGYTGNYTIAYQHSTTASLNSSGMESGHSGGTGGGPASGAGGSGSDSGGSGSGSGSSTFFTALPQVGQVIRQGQSLFAINGTPSVLLYGTTPAWRTLSYGVTGSDVAELNADLVALGDATTVQLDPTSDYYGAATTTAVKGLQARLGAPQTGILTLGQVTFLPTAVRVITVPASVGAPVSDPVLTGTSPVRQVTATLPATQRAELRVGDGATIELADGRTTSGVVASVGNIATQPSSNGPTDSSTGPPTVAVAITPTRQADTGTVDQAPITVAITTATVRHVLAVPAAALVDIANGHAAIEEVGADNTTHTVRVELGLFDDANGLVQITGTGLGTGQHVALPGLAST